MSYQSWHIYGYGICVSDLEIESPERIQALLHHAPEYERQVEQWLKEENITDPTVEDYGEVDNEFLLGFATLLKKVIAEAEHIQFTACDDCEGIYYLVYEPTYPWNRQEMDQKVTQEMLDKIIRKYVSILTDQEILIDYCSVENGG